MSKRPRNWKDDSEAVRRVLMSEWNPIGFEVPNDEYDSYIPVIYRLLQERVSVDTLAAHLEKIETEQIGLSARPDVNRRVAGVLLDLIDSN